MAWDINPDTLEFLQSELLFVFFMCVVFLIFCKGTVHLARRKMCYTYKICVIQLLPLCVEALGNITGSKLVPCPITMNK